MLYPGTQKNPNPVPERGCVELQEGRLGAWRGMVGLHDAPRVSGVAHVPPVQGSSGTI